ncbi:MAG: hypothetical protein AB3X44_09745 [Leptothrix sp. (in: b-proteobacteria)]
MNPQTLLAEQRFIFGVYRVITWAELFFLCTLVCAYFALVWIFWLQNADANIIGNHSLIASVFLAVLGLVVIAFTRKIAKCIICFAHVGDPLPIVLRYTEEEHVTGVIKQIWGKIKQHQLKAFDFHLAVRETEPNVVRRLKGYIPKDRSHTVDLSVDDDRHQEYLSSIFPAPKIARKLLISENKNRALQDDISPICRLAIGRSLYQRELKKTKNRSIGEESEKPELKSNHYYFTFKLHLVLISSWFLILAISILAPQLAPFQDHKKEVGVLMAVAFLLWAIVSLGYNRKVTETWRRWLEKSGNRALGRLPIFLYIPKNDAKARWEELDELDFKSYLDSFVLDTVAVLPIILGTMVGLGLTISGRVI